MSHFLKTVGFLGLLAMLTAPSIAEIAYDIIPLGKFSPTAMNSQGDTVGFTSSDVDGHIHAAVVYHDSYGIINVLPNLNGIGSQALDINDNGNIVGISDVPSTSEYPDETGHAFLYCKGTVSDIGPTSFLYSSACGINNTGQIVGTFSDDSSPIHTFLLNGKSIFDISPPNNINCGSNAINDSGVIVGSNFVSQRQFHAVVFRSGDVQDLGTLGGDNSSAYAVNSSGDIVGEAQTKDGLTHAFLYSENKMIDLDPLPSDKYSMANDINDRGQIVGSSYTLGPFLYSDNRIQPLNAMLDNSLSIALSGAVCINNSGEIVATDLNGYAYLLTPIPEPQISILLAIFSLSVFIRHLVFRGSGKRQWSTLHG